jgi:hypothetical protein
MNAINRGYWIKLNQNKNIAILIVGPPVRLTRAVRTLNTAPVANTIRKINLKVSIT